MITAKYLTREEALELKNILEQNDIRAAIKRQGPPRFLGGMLFHQIQIAKIDSQKAEPVVERFLEKETRRREKENLALQTSCPRCESREIHVCRKKILEKIFYVGVTIRCCSNCDMKWFT